jgi:hypothetical protein
MSNMHSLLEQFHRVNLEICIREIIGILRNPIFTCRLARLSGALPLPVIASPSTTESDVDDLSNGQPVSHLCLC